MYCRKCGDEVPEGADFCPVCGFPVQRAAAAPTTGRRGRHAWILILAAVLVIAAGAFFALRGVPAHRWQEQYELGQKYLDEGDYEQAAVAFRAAIEIDPKNVEAYVGRGNACMKLSENYTDDFEENLSQAEEDFLKAIQLDEKNAVYYKELGDLYIFEGKFGKAAEILSKGAENTGDASIGELSKKLSGGRYVLDIVGSKYVEAYTEIKEETFGVKTTLDDGNEDDYSVMLFQSEDDAFSAERGKNVKGIVPMSGLQGSMAKGFTYNGLVADPFLVRCYKVSNFSSINSLKRYFSRWLDSSLYDKAVDNSFVESDGSLYLVNTLGSGELVDQSSVSWTQWVDGSFVVELNTNLRETTYSPCFDVKLRLADGGNGLRITSADSECLYPGIHYAADQQVEDGTPIRGPYISTENFQTAYNLNYDIPVGFESDYNFVVCGYGQSFYNKSLDMRISIFAAPDPQIPGTLKEAMDYDYNAITSVGTVTYSVRSDKGFTVSGYGKGGSVFYKREIVDGEIAEDGLDGGYLYSVSISYPAANKLYCDKILTHFFDTVKY